MTNPVNPVRHPMMATTTHLIKVVCTYVCTGEEGGVDGEEGGVDGEE